MSNNVGISVNERDSADAIRVVPSDIFTMGAAFKSRRGPVGVAYPVYNVNEDKKVFGEYSSSFLGGYIRRGLFRNCEEFGAKILGTRVVASDAVTATKTFNTASTTPAWIFKSGVLGYDSPGLDGNNTYVEIKASLADADKRDVYVSYKSVRDAAPVIKEIHEYLDSNTVVDTINRKSFYVKVALASAGIAVPDVAASAALATGVEGVASITDSNYVAAYSLFDGLGITTLMNCDLHALASAQSLQTYAEGRNDIVGAIQSPQAMVQATLISTYEPLLKAKSFITGFRGWGTVDSEFGGVIQVPMLGHALGAGYIRKCIERGGYPWIAPAGEATALRDVYELEFPSYSDSDVATIRDGGFNPIQFIPGAGFIVRTSRTFSTLRKHYSVHVRRMTNWFKTTFRASFLWVEQEANNDDTRSRVTDTLTFFAQDCWKNGAFRRRGGYANNVQVKCDDENNTADMEDNGQLQADFTFHPVECVEGGTINIYQTRDDIKVTEK